MANHHTARLIQECLHRANTFRRRRLSKHRSRGLFITWPVPNVLQRAAFNEQDLWAHNVSLIGPPRRQTSLSGAPLRRIKSQREIYGRAVNERCIKSALCVFCECVSPASRHFCRRCVASFFWRDIVAFDVMIYDWRLRVSSVCACVCACVSATEHDVTYVRVTDPTILRVLVLTCWLHDVSSMHAITNAFIIAKITTYWY